jgi:hypothetical protein
VKVFGMKFAFFLVNLTMLALSGCVPAHNGLVKSPGNQDVPPWGDIRYKGRAWVEGRPIIKNPATATMREVFLDLGFYDSDRNAMGGGLERESSCESRNYFFYRGSGADPKLEIYRKSESGGFVLEVYVANSAGFDNSISWRYDIGYDVDSNHWVFQRIEGVRNHRWRTR